MPEFYIIIARKIFLPNLGIWARAPPQPPPRLLRLVNLDWYHSGTTEMQQKQKLINCLSTCDFSNAWMDSVLLWIQEWMNEQTNQLYPCVCYLPVLAWRRQLHRVVDWDRPIHSVILSLSSQPVIQHNTTWICTVICSSSCCSVVCCLDCSTQE